MSATALEVAADDMNAGLWQDGTRLLTHIVDTAPDKSRVSPLDLLLPGLLRRTDAPARQSSRVRSAGRKSFSGLRFPFPDGDDCRAGRCDAHEPIRFARAPYYLGNLLFDWQPQQAQALWEKSASLGADFPVVYRNLAMVYTRNGNQRDKALAALEKGSPVRR